MKRESEPAQHAMHGVHQRDERRLKAPRDATQVS